MLFQTNISELLIITTAYFTAILACIIVGAVTIQRKLNESILVTALLSGGITLTIFQIPLFIPLPSLMDFTTWVVLTLVLYWARPENFTKPQSETPEETISITELFDFEEVDYLDWP